MAAPRYMVYNGPVQSTAAPASVTTGTAIKTLLQIAPSGTSQLEIVEWGISFDGSALATPIKCELIQTDVAATVTAYAAADITKFGDPGQIATTIQLGTALSGYTASAEGTPTAVTRTFDLQLVSPTSQYIKQFPLGERPVLAVSRFLRVRVTAAAAVNAYCYVVWVE